MKRTIPANDPDYLDFLAALQPAYHSLVPSVGHREALRRIQTEARKATRKLWKRWNAMVDAT